MLFIFRIFCCCFLLEVPYSYFLQDLRNRSEYLLLIGEFNQLIWITTTEILRFISTPFMLLYLCVCVCVCVPSGLIQQIEKIPSCSVNSCCWDLTVPHPWPSPGSSNKRGIKKRKRGIKPYRWHMIYWISHGIYFLFFLFFFFLFLFLFSFSTFLWIVWIFSFKQGSDTRITNVWINNFCIPLPKYSSKNSHL